MRLVLWPNIWSILQMLNKHWKIIQLKNSVLFSLKSTLCALKMSHIFTVFFLVGATVQSITEKSELKSLSIFVICLFLFLAVALNILRPSAYIFRITVFYGEIETLIIMKCFSFSLIICLALNSTLSDNNNIT